MSKVDLVLAAVVEIKDDADWSNVEFEVKELIIGQTCNVGDCFSVPVFFRSQVSGPVISFSRRLQVADQMIWPVRCTHKTPTIVREDLANLGFKLVPSGGFSKFPMPVSALGSYDVADANIALAQQIRNIVKVDSRQRWKMLEHLCLSRHGAIAGWAMTVMGDASRKDAIFFLERLLQANVRNERTHEMARDLLVQLKAEAKNGTRNAKGIRAESRSIEDL